MLLLLRPLFVLLLCTLFALPLASQARESRPLQAAQIQAEAETIAAAFFEAADTPGLAISVGLEGNLAWSTGLGVADLEQNVPVDPAKTRFRIGSVIKPMTAYAIALLVDQGALDLDAPVQAYVPSFPQKQAPVTTRALLAHLAGIRHYEGEEFLLRERFDTVEAGLEIFQDDPLVHAPGTAYLYSSYGYNLLGAVIEGASGEDYLGYMQSQVLAPLGMNDTVPDHLAPVIPGRGRYYIRNEGQYRNAPEVDNSYKWASGGYIGTSDDLVRFGLAMLQHQGISARTQQTFWTEQRTSANEPTGYGLGWRIQTDEDGRLWIGHTGGSVGGTTSFWVQPETGLVLAAISNLSGFDFGTLLVDLSKLFAPDIASRQDPGP